MTPATLWAKGETSLEIKEQAKEEGRRYKQAFEAHVQFVFSRVQHHWHALDEQGKRLPLKYCLGGRGNTSRRARK